MNVSTISRDRTRTTVYLRGCESEPDDKCLHVAIVAAGETLSSLFGWHVTRLDDGSTRVDLDLD